MSSTLPALPQVHASRLSVRPAQWHTPATKLNVSCTMKEDNIVIIIPILFTRYQVEQVNNTKPVSTYMLLVLFD